MIKTLGSSIAGLQNAGAVPTLVRKTVTFVAGTTGATTTHNLFTVTGLVRATVAIYCTTDLTVGGSTTLSVGTASDGVCFVDGTDGPLDLTTVDAGSYITPGGTAGTSGATLDPPNKFTTENLIYTVGTSTITGGVLEFICEYVPLSAGASVVAA